MLATCIPAMVQFLSNGFREKMLVFYWWSLVDLPLSTSIDIDECISQPQDCSPDGICTNLEGSFQCSCPSGLTGDGTNCYGRLDKRKAFHRNQTFLLQVTKVYLSVPLSSSNLACAQIVKITILSNDYKFYCKIAAVKMVSSQRFGVKLRKVEKSSTYVFSSVYPKHKNGGDITKYWN